MGESLIWQEGSWLPTLKYPPVLLGCIAQAHHEMKLQMPCFEFSRSSLLGDSTGDQVVTREHWVCMWVLFLSLLLGAL